MQAEENYDFVCLSAYFCVIKDKYGTGKAADQYQRRM
jgi:hypothetical protein